jgi:hypothetical protein
LILGIFIRLFGVCGVYAIVRLRTLLPVILRLGLPILNIVVIFSISWLNYPATCVAIVGVIAVLGLWQSKNDDSYSCRYKAYYRRYDRRI